MLGALTFFASNAFSSTANQILLTAFVSGVTIVIQYIIEFDNRLQSLEDQQVEEYELIKAMVEKSYAKISEATRLYRGVETSGLELRQVVEMLRSGADVQPDDPDIVRKFAQNEIDRLNTFFKQLSSGGTITYQGEDRDWLIALTRTVDKTLDATSLSTVDSGGRNFHGGFWRTDLGRRYLDCQSHVIRQGVRVRRVFILTEPSLADDDDFRGLCLEQHGVGVEVRILNPDAGVGNAAGNFFDIVLFDDTISYEVVPAANSRDDELPQIVKTLVVRESTVVQDRVRLFSKLWDNAVPFVP